MFGVAPWLMRVWPTHASCGTAWPPTAGLIVTVLMVLAGWGPAGQTTAQGAAKPGKPASKVAPKASPEVSALIRRLGSPEPAERMAAANKLGELGGVAAPAASRLVELYRTDDDYDVRKAAVVALGAIGPAVANEAVPAMVATLGERETFLYEPTCEALPKMGEAARRAVRPLLLGHGDEASAAIRKSATAALKAIFPDAKSAVPAYAAALDDTNRELRVAAAGALSELRDQAGAATPALVKALKLDGDTREAVLKTLKAIGPPAREALPALTELTKAPEADIRRQAQAAIDAINSATKTKPKS